MMSMLSVYEPSTESRVDRLLRPVLQFMSAGMVTMGYEMSLLTMSVSVFLTLVMVMTIRVWVSRLVRVSSWRRLVMFMLYMCLMWPLRNLVASVVLLVIGRLSAFV